jgi:hypothetical protein
MTDRLGRSLNETNDSIAEYIRRLQQGENLYGALQRSFRNHGQVLNFAKKDIEDLAKSVQDEQRVFTEFENKYKSLLDALGTPLSTAGGGIDLEIDPLGDSGEDAEEFAEVWISAFEYIGIRMDELRKEISETLAVDPAADVSNQVEEYHRLREELEGIEKAFEKQAEAEEKSINSRNAQLENLLQSLMTYEEQAIHVWDNQHKLLTDAWMSGEISLEQYMETLKRVDNAYAETMGRMKTGTDKVGDAMEQLGRLMASVFADAFDVLGKSLIEGEDAWRGYVLTVIRAIKQIVQGLLTQAIAALIAGDAKKGTAGLVLAGLGVTALLGMWEAHVNKNLQGLATGGRVTSSGAFMVGEQGPEMVHLRAGSAVTPNHMLGGMGGELTTRISGRDLEIVLKRSQSQTTNRRSIGG